MHLAFRTALKLLHPLMPFLTEELWSEMGYGAEGSFLMTSEWPQVFAKDQLTAWNLNQATLDLVDAKRDLIRAARQLRADYNIKPSQDIRFIVRPVDDRMARTLEEEVESVNLLVRGTIDLDPDYTPEGATPGLVSKAGNVFMPADGLIDVAAEVERLGKQLEELVEHIERSKARLSNENFVSKAPEDVVEQHRAKQNDLIEKADKIRALLKSLTA
jgi:valyl-tRNA synthetase